MDLIHPRCAGIDISKKDAKVAIRVAAPGRGRATTDVSTWGATTNAILRLREDLIAHEVTCVVIEATSDYWKPFYYVFEDAPFNVLLVNARQVRNMPGRKTDVSDAAWLAQLGAHGLVRGSFVPPERIRRLRDLTRTRTALTRERAREIQRLEKMLEDAGIKLTSVATDITGVSGRRMLDALITGERDPLVLASYAKGRMRPKIPQLAEALTGRFADHHAFLARTHLALIDHLSEVMTSVTAQIDDAITPLQNARDLITTIPGISTTIADIVIAETGADMSVFATAGHLASWAGTCPGANESAGHVKSTTTRPGNPHLKGALGIAAMAAAGTRNTYLAAKYRRVATRRGPLKALVAVEHDMLVAIWHMLTRGTPYADPGADFFTRRRPDLAKNHALAQLHQLGYDVTLTPSHETVPR